MLERRRKSGKERGGGEMKADFGAAAVGGAAVGPHGDWYAEQNSAELNGGRKPLL